MGKLLRAKPEGPKYLEGYPQTKESLKKAKWLKFIQKFRGYNKEVTKAFARSFNGHAVEVGDLKFTITEATVAAATSLPQEGERWFKNRGLDDQGWKVMLKNPGIDTSIFTKGIPVHAIKEEWSTLLLLVQKFITCEGRFGTMYMYHARIMMNFMEGHALNLPYFLLSSLKKMSSTVQKHVGHIEPHLYHHGFIKILIEDQLKNTKDTWEKFLIRNHFQEVTEASASSSPKIPKRSRRKERNVTAQDLPTIDTQETVQEEEEEGARNKKQKKDKGKITIQETYPSPEPSIEEDSQTLADRLAHLQAAAITKRKQKEKQSAQEKSTSSYVRRSSRLKGKKSVTQEKQSHFIDLGEGTPEKAPTQPDIESSPPHVESTPPRDESPFQPEPQPDFDFEQSPRKTPEVDPDQQEVYNYLESLEQSVAGPSTTLPLDEQVQSLKQEVFELEVLNRHIKQENEALKEQSKVDKIVHDNTMLHLGLWQKKNRKLKKKCKKLSRALINLKFRCLVKKPRTILASRRKRRRLDVLAEASEHMD